MTDPTLVSTPNWSERLGMALLELIEHLPTRGFGAGNTAGVLVTIDLDKLRSGIGAAGLDTGVRISARDARRLACNAAIIPAVLGGESQPLDLGRTRRLHSAAQRKALALTHDSCAIGTCDRPFAWTEIHHLHPWSEGGGPTWPAPCRCADTITAEPTTPASTSADTATATGASTDADRRAVWCFGRLDGLRAGGRSVPVMRVDGLDALLTQQEFSGVVLLRRGNDTVFEGAYGLASPRWGVANAMDTRFDTASITKLFTSVAVLQLVGRGELDLDTSIHTYADLSGTTISSEVTLRHLLTHTSGIADDADEEAGEDYAELWVDTPSYSVMATRDLLPGFVHKEPLARPGEQCRYCNGGYVLAGLAVEYASGQNYRDFVVGEIFTKAGMVSSGFFDRRDAEPNVAEGSTPTSTGGWCRTFSSTRPSAHPTAAPTSPPAT